MSNGISTVTATDMMAMCKAVAMSGIAGAKTAEQAFALTALALAEDSGGAASPAAFLAALGRAQRDYHLVNGKPSMKADTMLARFQQAGGKVAWTSYTDAKVVGVFSHPAGGDVTVEWTVERGKSSGCYKDGPWKNQPRTMMRARCISEGVRTVYPCVLNGAYTDDEIIGFTAPVTQPVQPAASPWTEAQILQGRDAEKIALNVILYSLHH